MASDLPADLLEEIFLRLDDAADLARASAACASFRRVVSDGRFRRRFRSLHRPPVLGILGRSRGSTLNFYPAQPPRRSAPAAHAVVTDFSVPILPEPTGAWNVSDVRGGRLLFSRHVAGTIYYTMTAFDKFLVYDPLYRRRVQIPAIPINLLAALALCERDVRWHFEPFLLPADTDGGEDDESDDRSFQLMCVVLIDQHRERGGRTFLYSSVTGRWHHSGTISKEQPYFHSVWASSKRYYARGCFYWVCECKADMLMLDVHEMKFSFVGLPPGTEFKNRVIVDVADPDRVGLLIPVDGYTLDLYSSGIGANDWRHDERIALFHGYDYWCLNDGAEGYALLQAVPRDEGYGPLPRAHYFTMDIKTLVVEQLCELDYHSQPDLLYASFLPPLAPPSV